MCKMKAMNNKLFLTAIFTTVGLYQSIHSMDNPKLNLSAQLNLWKTALPVQIPDLEAVGNNLGTKALANLVPLYDQYWGYVGLLRAHGFHGYADNFRNTIMPENLRDHDQKTKIGSLIRTLENILSRSSINVVDVIQAWACIALLHEKRADHQAIVDYTARLKGRLTAAQMPSALHESSHHEQEPKKVVVAPKSSPAFKAKSPIQDSKKTDDKAVGDKDVSKKDQAVPLGPVEGKKLSKQLCEQMFNAGNGRDALALMLARHYADVAEDKLDKNDLLANIAFMYRCLGTSPDGEQPVNIQAIVKDHAQGPFDESAATALLNIATVLPGITGQVVPSLQQARSAEDSTLFCGYYALFNALGFLQPDIQRLNRDQFAAFLGNCLQAIGELRHKGPFGNLSVQELRAIINQNFVQLPLVVVEMQAIAQAVQYPETELNEAFDDQRTADLLRQFISRQLNSLSIVAGIGDRNGHWIAIYATRNEGTVSIQVADSFHRVQEYTSTAMIRTRIEPFYRILTTAVENWHELAILMNEVIPQESEPKLPIGKDQSKVADKQAQLKAPIQPKKASAVGAQASTGSVPTKPLPKPGSKMAAAHDVPVTTDAVQEHPVVPQVTPIATGEAQDKPDTSEHACVPIDSDEQSDMAHKADPQDLDRTIEILQARTEDLAQALKTMTEERDRSGEELEQLRAENTALRGKSAPEEIDSAALKGENVRLASQVQELREQLLTANKGRDIFQAMYDSLIEEHRKLQVSAAESSCKGQSVSDDNHGGLKVLQQRMEQGDGDAVISEALQAYFHVSEPQVHAILEAQEEQLQQLQQLLSSQMGSEHDQEAEDQAAPDPDPEEDTDKVAPAPGDSKK